MHAFFTLWAPLVTIVQASLLYRKDRPATAIRAIPAIDEDKNNSLPYHRHHSVTSVESNRSAQTPAQEAAKFYGPDGAQQILLHDPGPYAVGSIILLAPWSGEPDFWKWMYGSKLQELTTKPWRVIEVIGRKLHDGALGWYEYGSEEDWNNEYPMKETFDGAVAFVHALLQQEYGFVKDFRRIVLSGYSQGAILALEAGLRFQYPLAAVVSQRGILLDERVWDDTATLAATPYVFTAGDEDEIFYQDRVQQGPQYCYDMGAKAFMKTFEGLGHGGRSDSEVGLAMHFFEAALCGLAQCTLACPDTECVEW